MSYPEPTRPDMDDLSRGMWLGLIIAGLIAIAILAP